MIAESAREVVIRLSAEDAKYAAEQIRDNQYAHHWDHFDERNERIALLIEAAAE